MFGNSSISFSSGKQRSTSDDNLIPLINIVFLLLIFFMVAGKIAQKDITDIEPPKTSAKLGAIHSEQTILIDSRGMLWINDNSVASIESLQPEPLNKALSALDMNRSVVLKISADLAAKNIDSLLQVLRTNQVAAIELAVIEQ